MYFADLEPYMYGLPHPLSDVVTVGWLSEDRPFSRGDIDPETFSAIEHLLGTHRVNQMRGFHLCDFCGEPAEVVTIQGGRQVLLGSAEIWVPSADLKVIYAAPDLLPHYIAAHHYLPALEFLEAVQALPIHPDWDAEKECERRLIY